MRQLAAQFIFILAFSCSLKNNDKSLEEPKNTFQERQLNLDSINKIDYSDLLLKIEGINIEWREYYQKKNKNFNIAKFQLQSIIQLDALIEGNVLGNFNLDFNLNNLKFLSYSPDSLKYIDLFSYLYNIKRDKKNRLYTSGGEADQEVNLVDLQTKLIKRLCFMGSDSRIEDAKWLDNQTIILYGIYLSDSKTLFITIIDLNKRLKYNFIYQENIKGNYLKDIKLRDIEFR